MKRRVIPSGTRKFNTWIVLDEKTEDEVKVQVEYDYSQAEPMVRYYPDGSGYPGSPAMIEVVSVTLHSGRELDWAKLSESTRESIEEKCWEDVDV